MSRAIRDWEIPGVAVAIVKDDSVVLARGFGVRRLGTRDSVDANTLFGVASNTKAMAAASLAILVDEGKLGWDDRVIDHLPWFRLADPYATREMRIRDLLSHRSGLPAYGGDINMWASTHSREEDVRRIRHLEPESSFRSEYAYQNSMFVAAGEIVEAVTGKSWDEFVAERIFRPLGMTRTTTEFDSLGRGANAATGHLRLADGRTIPIAVRDVENIGAAAAVNSSARDMAQWLRLQLGGGTYGGARVFSGRAAHEMWALQTGRRLAPDSLQPAPAASFAGYGLGWSLRDYRGRKMVQHGGWTDGMLSQTAMLPSERLGVVVLTNHHNRAIAGAVVQRVFDAWLGVRDTTDWSAYFLERTRRGERRAAEAEAKLAGERAKGTRPSLPLERYAGRYRNAVYGDVVLAVEDGKLAIRMLESPTFVGTLEHWHHDTFRPTWRDPVLESHLTPFGIDEQGVVRTVRINVGEFIDPSTYTFTRVEEGDDTP
jgi:CubicO group peptidase (beta-lactamase class C family)